MQNECDLKIVCIRSDHGGEFENSNFIEFCKTHGIRHEFSAPRTPQQNGVVERKNRVLEEMSRTMLCENSLPKYFWAEAINILAILIPVCASSSPALMPKPLTVSITINCGKF